MTNCRCGADPRNVGPGARPRRTAWCRSRSHIRIAQTRQAMSVKTSTAPELTQEQVLKFLVQPLRESSKFLNSGVKIVDSAGPLRVPVLKGLVAENTTTPEDPSWVGEGELIPKADVDFGSIQLLPSTMESVKIITKWTAEMARQSVLALDAVMQSELIFKVVEKIDRNFLGVGGDGITTPKGILGYSGVQVMDKANAALTYDDMITAMGMCMTANVNMGALKWIMRPEQLTAMHLIKEATGSNRPLIQPDITEAGGFRILGAPVIVSQHLAKGPDSADGDSDADEQNVILADMSQILVARDLAPSVKILTELYAETDEIGVRVTTRYDAVPTNPTAIVKIKNIG
nr:phage major capsid protein [Sporichthya polymorpha]